MPKIHPPCPGCTRPLHPVMYDTSGMLNRDQWASQIAGQWYCKHCQGTRSKHTTYRYFWQSEISLAHRPAQVGH